MSSPPTTRHDPQPIELTTSDGMVLVGRVFHPPGTPDMTAVMLPGIGVPQRVFRHLAAWLAERGVRCLTVDYRGVNESAGTAGAIATATLPTWARVDAAAALAHAESQWPEPVVLIGHSFGGQIVGLSEAARRFRAVVMLMTGFGLSRHWDGVARLQVELYWRVILPVACTVFAQLPAALGLGNRLPRGIARDWARWGRSPEWFLSDEPGAADLLAAYDRPVLALAAGDDTVVPPRAVGEFVGYLKSAPAELRIVHPGDVGLERLGHVGALRPGAMEAEWRRALEFLRAHVR